MKLGKVLILAILSAVVINYGTVFAADKWVLGTVDVIDLNTKDLTNTTLASKVVFGIVPSAGSPTPASGTYFFMDMNDDQAVALTLYASLVKAKNDASTVLVRYDDTKNLSSAVPYNIYFKVGYLESR